MYTKLQLSLRFLFPFCFKIAISQVQVSRHPVDTTVDTGHTAVLFCSLSRRERFQQVAWVKDGIIVSVNSETPIYKPQNSRYSVDASPGSGDFNFIIADADPIDAGMYYCIVPRTTAMSTVAKLTVNFPPPDGYPKCSTNQFLYQEGNVLNAVCSCGKSQPIVDLKWTDGENDLPSIFVDAQSSGVTSTYQRVLTSADMNRQFYCHLNHALLPSTQVCKIGPLDIQYAPKNTKLFIMNEIVIGSAITILCNASANPEIQISEYEWAVPESLSPNRLSIRGNILKIKSIETSDNGTTISCKVVNAIGRGNASHVIVVSDKMTVLEDVSTGVSAGASVAIVLSVLMLLVAFSILFVCVYQKKKAEVVKGRPAVEAHLESVLMKHVDSQRQKSLREDRKLKDVGIERNRSTKGSIKPQKISKRANSTAQKGEKDDSVNNEYPYAIAPSAVKQQTSYVDDSETYANVSPGHSGTQDPTNTPQTNPVKQHLSYDSETYTNVSLEPLEVKQCNKPTSVPSTVTANAEGLTYADIDFRDYKSSSQTPPAHEEQTVYADVNI